MAAGCAQAAVEAATETAEREQRRCARAAEAVRTVVLDSGRALCGNCGRAQLSAAQSVLAELRAQATADAETLSAARGASLRATEDAAEAKRLVSAVTLWPPNCVPYACVPLA